MSSNTFNFEITGEEVVDTFKDQVKGRIFVITGPSQGGIGGETALTLCNGSPEQLVLLSRDQKNINTVMNAIQAKNPSISLTFIKCDLASQKSVRHAADELTSLVPHIDVLINNAATPPAPYSRTEDGIETQFGTNHIGHFLLTNLLMPKLLDAGSGARIVIVASSAHRYANEFDPSNFSDGKTYSEWDGYTQSKTANVLFSRALAEILKARGIQVFSLHPGSIASGMQSQVSEEAMAEALRRSQKHATQSGVGHTRAGRKNLQQGCATTLVAALHPGLSSASGAYLVDGQISKDTPSALVGDMANAYKLWSLSERLVGESFNWAG